MASGDKPFKGAPTHQGQRNPLGHQQITNLSAAVGLIVPANTGLVLIRCETKAVRFRDDGTDPTASVGMPLSVGDVMHYTGKFRDIKFIEQESGATLNVAYYQ